MEIVEVRNRKHLKDFIYFPMELYRDDHNWVPPIWRDEFKSYNPRNNAILAHSDFSMELVVDNGRILGRNLVYIDHNFNAFYRSRTGFFGSFECTNNFDAAKLLLSSGERWLKTRGMKVVRAPINPISENWGFLREGYRHPPVFMAPYNPPYYNDFFEKAGFHKTKDLLAYEADTRRGYMIPERFRRFYDRMMTKDGRYYLRRLDTKNLMRDAEKIWEISNEALKNNWGYVPLDHDEFLDMFSKLKMIVDPDAVWVIEDRGKMIGFALGFPDINTLIKEIKGKLFPFGFLKLLFGIKKLKDYRLFALAVLPGYHNRGIDVLLYIKLYESLSGKIHRLEANYILEDNPNIRNALEKLQLKLVKVYRVYEKRLEII